MKILVLEDSYLIPKSLIIKEVVIKGQEEESFVCTSHTARAPFPVDVEWAGESSDAAVVVQ